MLVVGLILIVLGLVGGALAVDVVLADPVAGGVSMSVLGIPVDASARSLLIAIALLGVVATLFVVVGVSIVTGDGRRSRRRERRSGEPAGPDVRTVSETRLWEVRLDELKERVRELEKRSDELLREKGILENHMRVHRIVGDAGNVEAVIVLPEAESVEEPVEYGSLTPREGDR